MSRVLIMVVMAALAGAILAAGCSTVQPGPSPPDGRQDPLVGLWISREPNTTTYYRFHENNTFEGWSHTGDMHPRYSYQYSGEWNPRGSYEYVTEGAHIGYGDVTALAIRRDLTLVYDPASDTFAIPVYKDQVFSRVSDDPDLLPELDHSGPAEVPRGIHPW